MDKKFKLRHYHAPGWLDSKAIVQEVGDPKVPVTQALPALCYHGLVVPNDMWSQYRRGGDLFREWYVQEVRRLIKELTPSSPNPAPDPPFWLQLISRGPLQAAFGHHIALAGSGGRAELTDQSRTTRIDQRGQRVQRQHNAARDIRLRADQRQAGIVRALKKTQAELTKVSKTGVVNVDIATDVEYHLKKALLEAQKPQPEPPIILSYLTQAQGLIAAIPEAQKLADALAQVAHTLDIQGD